MEGIRTMGEFRAALRELERRHLATLDKIVEELKTRRLESLRAELQQRNQPSQ